MCVSVIADVDQEKSILTDLLVEKAGIKPVNPVNKNLDANTGFDNQVCSEKYSLFFFRCCDHYSE